MRTLNQILLPLTYVFITLAPNANAENDDKIIRISKNSINHFCGTKCQIQCNQKSSAFGNAYK